MIARETTLDKNNIILCAKSNYLHVSKYITDNLTVEIINEFRDSNSDDFFDLQPNEEVNYLLKTFMGENFVKKDTRIYKISNLYERETVSKINEISLNYERTLLIKPFCDNPYNFEFYLLCWNKNKDYKFSLDKGYIITNNTFTVKNIINIYLAYLTTYENNKEKMLYYANKFNEWLMNQNKSLR